MGEAFLVSSDRAVKRVLGEEFAIYWPYIEAELDKIPEIWNLWWDKEQIYNGIISGRFQLWGAGSREEVHIMLITQVADYATGSVLQAILAFGNKLDENLSMMVATMESFARSLGCKRFEIHGRPGWTRKLRRFGKARVTSVVSFEISQERIQ